MKALTIYRGINMLSLDVTLGAVILSWSLGHLMKVEIPWTVYTCLGIAIWTIYTFDHLLDAKRIEEQPTTERHAFHKKYFRILSCLVVAAIIVGAGIAVSLPLVTFFYGIGLTCIVALYFAIILFYRGFYFKEGLVAFVYATGIFLGPLSLLGGNLSLFVSSLYIQLVIIAGINLMLFSYFEFDSDKKDGHSSLAIRMGQSKTKKFINLMGVILIVLQFTSLALLWAETSLVFYQLLFMIMGGVLIGIQKMENYFHQGVVYRLLGDAIFFIPGIYLLL